MPDVFLSRDFREGRIKLRKGKKPYLRKICTISKYKVWLVDGEYIRKNICEDFVNYDQHYHLRFIPKTEFWISKEAASDETRYYISHLLYEHRLMASGMSHREASRKADTFEKRERAKSEIINRLKEPRVHKREVIDRVRRRMLKGYSGKVKIWLVNGELVRGLFLLDYAGGGHDRVYHFIPDREVWIDDDIEKKERKFIILHELHERNLMSRGMGYPSAHWSATEIEDFFRHHPKKLSLAIRQELQRQR